jgi:formamidopyrimidine-DNA glycosylase
LVVEAAELEPYLAERLATEPLQRGFGARRLDERLAGRRTSIKAALLDQRTVAGMGNIYADEALWRAGIHPQREAGSLTLSETEALAAAVKAALRAGIRRQGATLRDYAQPDGRRGRMQESFKVYGRANEPCERCGTVIEKTRVAGRGTWFCPLCQPRYAGKQSSSRPSRSRRHSSV